MPLIRPFSGLRPAPGREEDVAAPPYDVLDTREAREQVAGRPWSFLHISRPEDREEGAVSVVTIIDYGAGNLLSVVNAVTRLGYRSKITSQPSFRPSESR